MSQLLARHRIVDRLDEVARRLNVAGYAIDGYQAVNCNGGSDDDLTSIGVFIREALLEVKALRAQVDPTDEKDAA